MTTYLLAAILWVVLLLGGWLLVGRSLGHRTLALRSEENHRRSDGQDTPPPPT